MRRVSTAVAYHSLLRPEVRPSMLLPCQPLLLLALSWVRHGQMMSIG